jgi:5-methylcytosine-specific restriction protein B
MSLEKESQFTWVATHKQLVEIIRTKRNNHQELIAVLKKVGITGFNDKNSAGEQIELREIDPFTFFCYIYKYKTTRLEKLQDVAKSFNIPEPIDDAGVPSVNPQKVWGIR